MKLKFFKAAICFYALTISFCNLPSSRSDTQYDIVLLGGRVIDPETKLDAIKNVGILNNRIEVVSSEPLQGKETIDVKGLVVAPGFIDMHAHGRTNREQEYYLHDGVTTAMELESGIEFLAEWYASRKSKALINYGASVRWSAERVPAIDAYKNGYLRLKQSASKGEWKKDSVYNFVKPSYDVTLSAAQINIMLENIKLALAAGGIGIGIPIGYLPGAKPQEIFRVYQLAGELKATIFTHVREAGIMAVQQAMADAMLTKAPLHIVHINSGTLGDIGLGIEMVQTARKNGFDISTELYPYTASSTKLQSAKFNEGWEKRIGISYGDLQWVVTGERLTRETFDSYRKSGGYVIIHSMKPEWIKAGIASSGTIIASDGLPYSKLAHPRSAGTFSRVLGKYVRDEKVLTLSEAIEKMTLLPAKRLEGIAPIMSSKGRIQVGADADITIFNPNTVIDKSTFEKGLEFSEGIEYVIVNGTIALKNGKTVDHVFPGQAVYGKYKK